MCEPPRAYDGAVGAHYYTRGEKCHELREPSDIDHDYIEGIMLLS